jgi:hypothetical protein
LVFRVVQIKEMTMKSFNQVVLSAIRGGGFEAELINETGYAEWSLSGRSNDPDVRAGVIVVWIDAGRSPDFAKALEQSPDLALTLVSNYGDLPCTALSISGWPPIRIELQPHKRLRAAA